MIFQIIIIGNAIHIVIVVTITIALIYKNRLAVVNFILFFFFYLTFSSGDFLDGSGQKQPLQFPTFFV